MQTPKPNPKPLGALVPLELEALLPVVKPITSNGSEARMRRNAARECERQIHRAMWRADRRARRVPPAVRVSMPYVNAQRRHIARELARWAHSIGAGEELAKELGRRAAERWPRPGVPLTPPKPRTRAAGDNPRALGESPRQRGTNPRAVRERQELEPLERAAAPAPVPHADAPPAPAAAGWDLVRQERERLEQLEREQLAGGRAPLVPAEQLADAMKRKGKSREELARMWERSQKLERERAPETPARGGGRAPNE